MKVVCRKSKESDHAFIFATYLRNRWFDKGNKTTLKRSTWSALQHKRLEGLINNILIACLNEDSDTILGYCFLDDNIPYHYIKLPFRNKSFHVAEILLASLNANLIEEK